MEKQQLEKLLHKSIRTIAKDLNVSYTNARYWLNKYGLKTLSKPGPKSVLPVSACLNCAEEFKVGKNCTGKYCTSQCQQDHLYKGFITKWKSGDETGCTSWINVSSYVRRYLLLKYNNSCIECGWNELHPVDNRPLVEIDHIDGDSANCREENLRVLCPNCHSKTPTYGARNKNSARYNKWREVRLIAPIG